MSFSSMKPKMSAVTAAVAAADDAAELAAAYKPPNPRDDMHSVAPTVEAPYRRADPDARPSIEQRNSERIRQEFIAGRHKSAQATPRHRAPVAPYSPRRKDPRRGFSFARPPGF